MTGIEVRIALAELGPVTYDATSESLTCSLGDVLAVVDAMTATAKALRRESQPLEQDKVGEHR